MVECCVFRALYSGTASEFRFLDQDNVSRGKLQILGSSQPRIAIRGINCPQSGVRMVAGVSQAAIIKMILATPGDCLGFDQVHRFLFCAAITTLR